MVCRPLPFAQPDHRLEAFHSKAFNNVFQPHCYTLLHMLHIATHCYTLLHIATHCYTLLHIATHCYTLLHIATHTHTHTQGGFGRHEEPTIRTNSAEHGRQRHRARTAQPHLHTAQLKITRGHEANQYTAVAHGPPKRKSSGVGQSSSRLRR